MRRPNRDQVHQVAEQCALDINVQRNVAAYFVMVNALEAIAIGHDVNGPVRNSPRFAFEVLERVAAQIPAEG
jgi:hypothetical protein